MAYSIAQIESLWHNNGMSQMRQSNSNRNEQAHNFKQLGKNAFNFSKDFSWDKIVKKYIKLI